MQIHHRFARVGGGMIITYLPGPAITLPRFVTFGVVCAGLGFAAISLLGLL